MGSNPHPSRSATITHNQLQCNPDDNGHGKNSREVALFPSFLFHHWFPQNPSFIEVEDIEDRIVFKRKQGTVNKLLEQNSLRYNLNSKSTNKNNFKEGKYDKYQIHDDGIQHSSEASRVW